MANCVVFTESSPNVGGQELQLLQQMGALQKVGYRCILACRPAGAVEAMARSLGLETLPVAFRNSFHLQSVFKLRALFSQTKARMVVCHSGHDANNVALACRLLVHRPFVLRSRTYLAGKCKAYSCNHLADATMVPSEFIKQSLITNSLVDAEKIHVVYPGIDFERIDAEAAMPIPPAIEQWLASSPGPVLLHVAMLRAEKGHLLMLQALAGLKDRWPGLRYLIAGEGCERAVIEREISALGLQHRVLLAGNVIPASALYRHVALVVMPSLREPLGMSQIEALGLGAPIVVSNAGGLPETVRDGISGRLVDSGNVLAWQQALDDALSNLGAMQRMAAIGRTDVRNRFSVEANLRGILDLQADYCGTR